MRERDETGRELRLPPCRHCGREAERARIADALRAKWCGHTEPSAMGCGWCADAQWIREGCPASRKGELPPTLEQEADHE